MAGKDIASRKGKIGDLVQAVREIDMANSRSEKELKKFKPRREFLKKIVGKKDGGLINAIEKVKAKEMKLGGEAKPLVGGQKKLDKNKDGRISGDDFAMMEMGGKVEEYGGGGKVKGGKMSCRGMGKAIKGGGFSIR